jgi:chemotaxis protein CheY-P-specific phosphatase CheC
MQPSVQTPALAQIFSEVLANLAFMFTAEPGEPATPGTPCLVTRISYQGPQAGELELWCPEGFAYVLASNLLGVDPEDAEARAKSHDAMKELMNVLCGQLVTTLHGTQGVFNLSIPELDVLDADAPCDPPADALTAELSVEGYPVIISYRPRA